MSRASLVGLSFLLAILLPLVFSACSGDDDDDSGGADDDTTDDDTDDDADDDSGDDDTWPPLPDDDSDEPWDNLSDTLGEGEVRAGVITAEDELIGGPAARGQIGDYKIYNSKIEVIVQAPEHPGVSFSTFSGTIIDADRARPVGEPGADCLQNIEYIMGLIRGFKPTGIEVAAYGHNGVAIIRVVGIDAGINFIDSAVATDDLPFRLMNEFILEPDKDYVTIRSTIFNDSDKKHNVLIADMPFWRGDTDTFVPRSGYNISDVDVVSFGRWVGSTNRVGLGVSYALATSSPARKFYSPYFYKDVSPLLNGRILVDAGGSGSYDRLFIVGDGDTRMFPEVINKFDNSPEFGVIEGTVTAPRAELGNVKVMVQDTRRPDGSNYVAALYPNQDGEYSVQVAPGQYKVKVVGEGRADSAPETVDIDAGETLTVDLDANPPGMLAIDVTDDGSDPIPCKVSLFAGFDANVNQQPVFRLFSLTGQETLRVPPGDYTAAVSRGYEYEIHVENITIEAGETTDLVASLAHSVDTTGQMSGDFHIHTIFSSDSHEPVLDRLKHLAAEGLEMPVITDHDVQVDWIPFVDQYDAGAWVKVINGTEISPTSGHFNSWPVVRPEGVSEYYSVPFMVYDDTMTATRRFEHPEMWDLMLANYGAQVFQINHPRAGGGGWLTYLGYDPAQGIGALDPVKWREDFQAIEVFNGGGNGVAELKDWFSFLDQGLAYTMTGNSDSHSFDSELGNPRNLFVMPTDNPADADQDDMIESVVAGRTQVSSGPVITFSIDGYGLGEIVANHGPGDVELAITVQAPAWMPLNFVEVLSNHGDVVFTDTIDPSENVVRYDEVVTLSPTDDAYFVVRAGHTSAKLGPVNPGQAIYALTNPIWVDIDDNGDFDPPGLPVVN